jgi:molybdate/tungstate transport system substrate-binding protein
MIAFLRSVNMTGHNMIKILLILVAVTVLATGCRNARPGEIIIFHAGSLSVPFKELATEYEKLNPGTKVLLEPAGSLVCARKITELKKPCDIIASSDYFVINELLIPDYTKWCIRFATNEIVIAFQEKSKYASEFNASSWVDFLLRDDVTFSRADPDSDPCGYRTLLTFKLAEKFYNRPGLAEKLASKNMDFIRPKEVDLVALVEANAVDYMFQYKSVAIQHNLKYIELPREKNLGDPAMNDLYKIVSQEITGSTPGSKMTVTGEYINYSLTVLENAPHSKDAVNFVSFLLSDRGMDIFRKNGQQPIRPCTSGQPEMIPISLKKYLN